MAQLNKESPLVGQVRIYMQPAYSFGALHLEFFTFKITKVFEKSVHIELLDANINSQEKRSCQFVSDYCFTNMPDAIKWNIRMCKGTIKNRREFLKTITKKHPDWQKTVEDIEIMKSFLAILPEFTPEKLKIVTRRWAKLNKLRVEAKFDAI